MPSTDPQRLLETLPDSARDALTLAEIARASDLDDVRSVQAALQSLVAARQIQALGRADDERRYFRVDSQRPAAVRSASSEKQPPGPVKSSRDLALDAISAATEFRREANHTWQGANHAWKDAIRAARAAGCSTREIAAQANITHARVVQLTRNE